MSDDSIKKPMDFIQNPLDQAELATNSKKDEGQINPNIVYTLIKSIADIQTGKTATTETSNMSPYEKAMVDLGKILVDIEAQLTKIQQFTSSALSDQSKIAVKDAIKNLQTLTKDLDKKKSTPWWETLVKVVIAVVAVTVGFLCGGPVGAAIALGLTVAAESGLINDIQKALVKAGFPSPGPEILVFTVVVAASLGTDSISASMEAGASIATSAATKAATDATEDATESAATDATEDATESAASSATSESTSSASEATELEASSEAIQSAKKALKAFMKIAKVIAQITPAAQASNLYPALAQALTTRLPMSANAKEELKSALEYTMVAISLVCCATAAFEAAPEAAAKATTKFQKFIQGGFAKMLLKESSLAKVQLASKIINAAGTATEGGIAIHQAVIDIENSPLFLAIAQSNANIQLDDTISQIANDTSNTNLKAYQSNMDDLQASIQELSQTFNSGAAIAKALAASG